MGFIINGIANIFMEIIGFSLYKMLSLVYALNLDIGVGKMVGKGTRNRELVHSGLFDQTFSTAHTFQTAFLVTAYVLLILIFMFKLITTLLGPITGSSEEPIPLVISTFIAAFFVWFSYDVFKIFQKVANKLLKIFKKNAPSEELFKKDEFYNALGDKLLKSEDVKVPKTNTPIDNIKSQTVNFKPSEQNTTLAATVVCFLVFFVITVQLLKLFLEMYERYVVLGVLFYSAPLAFATICSKSTMSIFSSWVKMVISQFLLMMMNVFFLSVFAYSFKAKIESIPEKPAAGYMFGDWNSFITTSILWIGWLLVGQKVDQHLQSLGMSTAQSGGGLAGAVIGAVGTTVAAAKMAGKVVSKGAGGAYNTAHRIDNGQKEKAAGGNFWDGFSRNPKQERTREKEGRRQYRPEENNNQHGERFDNARKNLHFTDKDGNKAYNLDAGKEMVNDRQGVSGAQARELSRLFNADQAFMDQGMSEHELNSASTKFEASNGNITATTADGQKYVASFESGLDPNKDGPYKTATPNESVISMAERTNQDVPRMAYKANQQTINGDGELLSQKLMNDNNFKAFVNENGGLSKINGTNNGVTTFETNNGRQWQAAPEYMVDENNSKSINTRGSFEDVSNNKINFCVGERIKTYNKKV